VRRLLALLRADREVPLLVFGAALDPIGIGYDLRDERVEVCCRIRSDRVFHADPARRR